jgi:hypothetical protein
MRNSPNKLKKVNRQPVKLNNKSSMIAIFGFGSKEQNGGQWLRPNKVCQASPRAAQHGFEGNKTM